MKKLVFIGGGSAKFIREVVVDLFSYEELRDFHISLMDIDNERVERSKRIVEKMIKELNIPATVEATLDQRKALEGADYVIITIMVGGFDSYKSDGEIPVKKKLYIAFKDKTFCRKYLIKIYHCPDTVHIHTTLRPSER